eukprot:3941927-Rhodomonas_salina.2
MPQTAMNIDVRSPGIPQELPRLSTAHNFRVSAPRTTSASQHRAQLPPLSTAHNFRRTTGA